MQTPQEPEYISVNRQQWNERTPVHAVSQFYDVESFKKGKTSLNAIERKGLGDVKDKSLLHLQCHFGQDTLSLARLGAKTVGIDLSDVAINLATQLNQELGLDSRFVCANLYDTRKHIQEKFDIVFTSYGVIGWLKDLNEWAEIIRDSLKKGGVFYMVEFHPMLWMMEDNFERIAYTYFPHNEPLIFENDGTYTDGGENLKLRQYEWAHSLSEVINALLGVGLELEYFNEYPYAPYDCFDKASLQPDGNYQIEGLEGKFPLLFEIKAHLK